MTEPDPVKLSDERVAAAKAAIIRVHEREQRIEELENKLNSLNQTLAEKDVQIESLNSLHNMLESRIAGALAQRDEAVLERGRLEGVIHSVAAVLVSSFRGGESHVAEDIKGLLDKLADSEHGERR